MYVLVFLCLETREAIASEATEHPNSAWVCEQADWFVDQTSDRQKKPEIFMHDRDTKFPARRSRNQMAKKNATPLVRLMV